VFILIDFLLEEYVNILFTTLIPVHFIWHFCFHIEWLIYILRQKTGKAGMRFEVLTMKKLHMRVFWFMTSCSLSLEEHAAVFFCLGNGKIRFL